MAEIKICASDDATQNMIDTVKYQAELQNERYWKLDQYYKNMTFFARLKFLIFGKKSLTFPK